MRMRMHSKSGIVNGLFPDRNRLVVIKVYPITTNESYAVSYGSVNSHGLWACANILTPKTGTDLTRIIQSLYYSPDSRCIPDLHIKVK